MSKNRRPALWALVIFVLLFTPAGQAASSCSQWRVLFDVGSSSTKMRVYKANRCEPKRRKRSITFKQTTVVLDQSLKNIPISKDTFEVKYKDDLKKNAPKGVSFETQDVGYAALSDLKSIALKAIDTEDSGYLNKQQGVIYSAVATSGFRDWAEVDGKAVEDFISKVERELGISIQVLTQDEEAFLGFVSAISTQGLKPKNVASWDIGGGSWQFMAADKYGNLAVMSGTLASKSFKEKILRDVKPTNWIASYGDNPNPFTDSEMAKSLVLARDWYSCPEFESIAEWLRNHGVPTIIGIGGVHGKSIPGSLQQSGKPKPRSYTTRDLRKTLGYFVNKNPKEDFSDTKITNLLYVSSLMEQLHLPQVRIADVNLADGLARHPNANGWKLNVQR